MAIARTAIVNDDGSGTSGTSLDNAWKQELYDQIDAVGATDTAAIAANTAAIALKAPLASPTFTGTPAAPTPAGADSTTKVATTAFVQGELSAKAPLASPALTGTPTAPTAAALTNTTQVATTAFVTTADALKAPLASPSFTGTVTAAALLDLSGAAAGQIKFPATQNSSANVNTLDDYEEGTWTPTLGGNGGTSGQTYSVRTGVYTKIGNAVVVAFDVTLSAKGTITGNVEIQGLPFALAGCPAVGAFAWNSTATNWVNMVGYMGSGTTAIQVFGTAAAGTSTFTALTTTDIGNSTLMRVTFIYTAAT